MRTPSLSPGAARKLVTYRLPSGPNTSPSGRFSWPKPPASSNNTSAKVPSALNRKHGTPEAGLQVHGAGDIEHAVRAEHDAARMKVVVLESFRRVIGQQRAAV